MGGMRFGLVLLGVALAAPALAQTSTNPMIREGTSSTTWNNPKTQTSNASPVSVELKWRFSTMLDEPVRELFGRYSVGGWGIASTATILNAPVCSEYGVLPSTRTLTLGSNDIPTPAWQQALDNVELLPSSKFRLHFGTISGVKGRLYMEVQADSLARADSNFTELRIPESPAWGRLFRVASGAQPAPDDPWLDETQARAVFARGPTVRYAEILEAHFDVSAVRAAYEAHLKATCQPKAQPQAATTSDPAKNAKASEEAKAQPRRAEPATEEKSPAKSQPMLDISVLGGQASSSTPVAAERTRDVAGNRSAPSKSGATGNEVRASMMLLIDASGSMQGSRIAEAKRAARDAIRRAASVPGTEFSVASFSGDCAQPQISVLPFTTDAQAADRFIQSITAGGGTPLGPAVSHVNRFMDKNRTPSSKTQIIILLADGADSCNDVSDQVARLKREGMLFRHETIGLETDAKTSEQLRQVASASGGSYHHAARTEELAETFKAATDNIRLLDMLGGFGKPNPNRLDTSSKGGVNWNILSGTSK